MLVLKPIAKINSDFTTKFGIPRQSGLVKSQLSTIVFEPEYRDANALRGLEEYSHIWLIWGFSEVKMEHWSPMVKPPRLGGNKRMGVFATRSPYRPNPIGLSCVKLVSIDKREGLGNVLTVSGADLMDGTPIYDIKPYLSFTDSHQDAENGFAGERLDYSLDVSFILGVFAAIKLLGLDIASIALPVPVWAAVLILQAVFFAYDKLYWLCQRFYDERIRPSISRRR